MTGIILNWNSWQNPIACLKSLYNMSDNVGRFFITVDNGSTDDSIEKTGIWLSTNIPQYRTISEAEEKRHPLSIEESRCFIYKLNRNYSFAKENNIEIKLAREMSSNYYLLLNNNIEVEPDSLEKLMNFSSPYQEYEVLTPLIRYYFDKEKIWNYRGKLFFGFRKYYCTNSFIYKVKEKNYIPISFLERISIIENIHIVPEKLYILIF